MTRVTGLRLGVVSFLGAALLFFAEGLLATVPVSHRGITHVWPVHSHYVLPIILTIWGYALLGLGVVLIAKWLLVGEDA